MIENIKVDIIYFMTATDFEFEFNLGGCCRMRLLNDKVSDKKSFVNSLARAVSRSQIIIGVGPLFGEDGLIATTAAAISHPLQVVNNKAYGIASEEKIEVIEGAVPLVTGEGYFGGSIIESGNQSIILLTENRTVRKSIMKTLVHPYIEDMCIMQSTDRTGSSVIPEKKPPVLASQDVIKEDISSHSEQDYEAEQGEENGETFEQENIESPAETSSDTEPRQEIPEEAEVKEEPEVAEPAQDEEHNIEFDFSGSDEDGKDEAKSEISSEIEQDSEEMYFMPEEDDEDEAYEPISSKKKGKGLNIAIFVLCILLLVVVFAICYFLIFMPLIGGVSTTEYFKEIFSTVSKV